MREILFRGQTRRHGEKVWMNGEKVPSNWVYGGICFGKGDFSIIYAYMDEEKEIPIEKHVVYTDTVGQFTGLYDSSNWYDLSEEEKKKFLTKHTIEEWKGRPIFENDIVGFGDIIGIVNYGTGCYCVKTNKPDWMSRNNPAIDIILNEYPNEIKVIGNIHDNPELLKGGERE